MKVQVNNKKCSVALITSGRGGIRTFSESLIEMMKPNFNVISYHDFKCLSILLNRRRKKFDIIHTNYASFGVVGLLTNFFYDTPYIYTIHGLPQPDLAPTKLMKTPYLLEKDLASIISNKASKTVTISNYVAKRLENELGVSSDVIYHGIKKEDIQRITDDQKKSLRAKYGIPVKTKIILFVGKFSRYKDPLTLVKAFKSICEKQPSVILIMVGSGPLEPLINKEISGHNLTDRVVIMRNISKTRLFDYYSIADVFVQSSVNEMFGLVLLEAMSKGLPIIASNSGACPEVVGDAGILFERGNNSHLAEALTQLLGDYLLRKNLSEESIRRVAENFTLEKTMRNYHKVYNDVMV